MQRKVSKEVLSPPLKPRDDTNKTKQKNSPEIKPLRGAKTKSPDVIDYEEGQKYDSDEYEVVEVTDTSEEEEEVEHTPPPAQDMNARRQAWMRARQREEKEEEEEVKLPRRNWRRNYRGSTSDES